MINRILPIYNKNRIISLSNCVDEDGVKIRKDESFQKNYLNGKYKGIPCINNSPITDISENK